MSQRRLLLADDSVTIQKVVNLTFADEGIDVVAVGDGDAAMQKFVEAIPDLVMVDVNMPGLDGYRICEMIKQDDETKHIPVILLVGSFEPFDEAEARRVGADDYLTKPFQSIRQLVNKVSDLLNGKTGGNSDEISVSNSFDDTLEMNLPAENREVPNQIFSDPAFDDEMIHTDQIGSLPANEAQKFESAPTNAEDVDSQKDTADRVSVEESNVITAEEKTAEADVSIEENSKSGDEFSTAENTEEEYRGKAGEIAEPSDAPIEEAEPMPRHENIYEFASEQEFAEEQNFPEQAEPENVEADSAIESEAENAKKVSTDDGEPAAEIFAPESVTQEYAAKEIKSEETVENKSLPTVEAIDKFDFDDFDLLELPQTKKSKSEKAKISSEQSNAGEVELPTGSLSPEEIEAVADRVVEKLSDTVVKRIVREVFNQMSKKK